MTEFALNPHAAIGNAETNLTLHLFGSSANMVVGPEIPPVISRGQAYYWTRAWQDFERASERALAAGEYSEFANPADAIRWLLSDEG